MARKTYSEEFRWDEVELYRSTPGATVVGIAEDLGIMDTTLSGWLKAAGVPLHTRAGGRTGPPPPGGQTPEQELAELRSRVAEFEASARAEASAPVDLPASALVRRRTAISASTARAAASPTRASMAPGQFDGVGPAADVDGAARKPR